MNLQIGRFGSDERGTTFEGIALSVSILAVAFVASADMLDFATKSQDTSNMFAAHKVATPSSVGTTNLDETPTASLPALVTRSVLDPCTGRTR